jgi:recombination protein RecA
MLALSTPQESLPQDFLQRAKRIGLHLGTNAASESYLPFGFGQLKPEQGLLRGQVTELCVSRSSGLATTLALSACVEAQRQGLGLDSSLGHWCAYVDPSASLYAPGVKALGVELERLLVVRPPREALASVTLRLVRSKTCVLVVVDTAGVPGQPLNVELGAWVRVVRQMSLALEGSQCSVLLITDAEARRPMPLPVARRIELCRPNAEQLQLRVVKDRFREPAQAQRFVHRCPTFAEPLRHSA